MSLTTGVLDLWRKLLQIPRFYITKSYKAWGTNVDIYKSSTSYTAHHIYIQSNVCTVYVVCVPSSNQRVCSTAAVYTVPSRQHPFVCSPLLLLGEFSTSELQLCFQVSAWWSAADDRRACVLCGMHISMDYICMVMQKRMRSRFDYHTTCNQSDGSKAS